jgi:DNA-binding transcriptional MerR regulator
MAYTVKQVAAMSGVSVRTLHFYDETGLLKPAYLGANGYRFYEEPQLLTLQQILFYRELGFDLKQIKRILGRRDFEIAAALQSHRKVLQKTLARTRRLIETIDKTIQHLKGTRKMKSQEMFVGFSVAAGKDRFNEQIKLGGPGGVSLLAHLLCRYQILGGLAQLSEELLHLACGLVHVDDLARFAPHAAPYVRNFARHKNAFTGTEVGPFVAHVKLKLARNDIDPLILIVMQMGRSAAGASELEDAHRAIGVLARYLAIIRFAEEQVKSLLSIV